MILKIKGSKSKWVFFDKVDKLVTYGIHYVTPQGSITDLKESNSDFVNTDAAYIIDQSSDKNTECIVVEITRYRSDDNSYFSRIIALQEAFILNDEGKTIEKLA